MLVNRAGSGVVKRRPLAPLHSHRSVGPSSNGVRFLFPLVFALLYATALADLPLDVFMDRYNYLLYAQSSHVILARYAAEGSLSLLANEPLWLLINVGLAQFLAKDDVLRVIIFVPACLVSYLLLRKNPRHAFWMIFFLLMPLVIKNHIIHLRQGVGLSVFMLGYFSDRRWLRAGLMLASGFIHTSFLLVAMIGIMVWISSGLRFSLGMRNLFFILCFVLLGLMLAGIAAVLGARQGAQYSAADIDVSGLAFLYWTLIVLLFMSAGKNFLVSHIFPFAILIFYLAVYFLTPVSGRILESGLFLVLSAGLALYGWRRRVFLSAIVALTLFVYASRADQPWLGWGVV